jgi:hypothetical protein
VNGLLTRSTLAINGCAWYRLRKTCRQRSVAPNVQALLAYLANTAYNDIFYQAGL